MKNLRGRTAVGREGLVFVGVLVLIALGTVFLWFPSPAPAPTVPPTSPGTTTPGGTVPIGPGIGPALNATSGTLSSFQTYNQLHDFISANAKSVQQQYYPSGGIMMGGAVTVTSTVGGPVSKAQGAVAGTMTTATMTMTAPGATVSSTTVNAAAAGTPFTGTNNQVQGVDELDKVKTDGSYLYVASSQSVSIIKAQPADSTLLVAKIALPTTSIMGIELAPQRLAVLGQSNINASVNLRLYDVSNPAAPKLLNSIRVAGNHVGARLAQGYFYEIVQQPSYGVSGNRNVTAQYPSITEDGVGSVLSPGSVYYTPNKSQISVYTMILSMSMTTGQEQSTAVLTGQASTIYVSTSNIYVVYPNYPTYYVDNIPGDVYGQGGVARVVISQPQNSTVFRVAYSSGQISAKAAGSFPGVVLNQFSMDEYNGYFRVATSRAVVVNGTGSRSDDVYVMSQDLTQVAAVRNIAPGENIYAVRFDGDTGYVVTFEQVDPLFAISFKNPTNPVITSALKISSGFSDYLQPLANGYLVGVGKDTVQSSNGNFAYYLGLKLSLFHVASDGTSTEVSSYLIGDRGTDSAVLNDHLAFTFDSTRNIMVLPVNLAKVSGTQQTSPPGSPPPYGQMVWQGVYVMNVTTAGFKLMGTVSQYPASSTSYWGSSGGYDITRSVIIGNALYTVSNSEVLVSSLSNFSTLATVALN